MPYDLSDLEPPLKPQEVLRTPQPKVVERDRMQEVRDAIRRINSFLEAHQGEDKTELLIPCPPNLGYDQIKAIETYYQSNGWWLVEDYRSFTPNEAQELGDWVAGGGMNSNHNIWIFRAHNGTELPVQSSAEQRLLEIKRGWS